jgi:hypothetical protein
MTIEIGRTVCAWSVPLDGREVVDADGAGQQEGAGIDQHASAGQTESLQHGRGAMTGMPMHGDGQPVYVRRDVSRVRPQFIGAHGCKRSRYSWSAFPPSWMILPSSRGTIALWRDQY